MDCCLSVCLPVRPSACSSSRLSVRPILAWFLGVIVFFVRYTDSLERSSLHDTDALFVFFLYRVFIFDHVFGTDALFTCVLIYEFFVHTAKQSLTIISLCLYA